MAAPDLNPLASAIHRLATAGVDTPNLDASLILCNVLGCTRTELIAHPTRTLDASQEAAFEALIKRREAREPLPHLLGEWEFMGHAYEVGPQALIPRPETEMLVEAVVERLRESCEQIRFTGLTPQPPSPQGKGGPNDADACVSDLPSPRGREAGGEARVPLTPTVAGLTPQPPSLQGKGEPDDADACVSDLPSPHGRGAGGEARATDSPTVAGQTPQPPSVQGKGEPDDADASVSDLPSPRRRGAGGEARVPQSPTAAEAHEPYRILDVGTGTGCIAIELALRLPQAQVTTVDLSQAALALASRNAARFRVENCVDLRLARFPEDVSDLSTFDAIVSNPPYIPSAEVDRLERELTRFEPRAALDGGADGLDVIRSLVTEARRLLNPGGLLAMEIGHDQAETVQSLLRAAGWTEIETLPDLAGHLRIVLAR